jgi:hypothetical protein
MKLMLAISLTFSFLMWGCGKSKGGNAEHLDSTIRRELPLGTGKSAVLSFLEQHKIPRDDSRDISYYKGPRRVWGKLSESHGLTVTDFTFTFEFDEKDRLVSYTMKKQVVGP